MPDDNSAAAGSELISVADYALAAERLLDPGALAYFAGGAGDEITMRDNLAAWQRLAIRPRTLVGVGQRDPAVTLLGRRRPHPLIVAPTAYQRLAHVDGELANRTRSRGDRLDHVPLDVLDDHRAGCRCRPFRARPAGFSSTCSPTAA